MTTFIRNLTMLALLLLPAVAAAADVHSIMAVVNGEIITNYDYEARWASIERRLRSQYGDKLDHPEMQAQLMEIKGKLLAQMVDEVLVNQEAARMNIEVGSDEIDAYVSNMRRERGLDDEAFQEFLDANGVTEEEMKESIREDMIKQRMVRSNVSSRIVVTEQEIRDAYADKVGVEAGETVRTVELSVIMAPDETAMEDIVGKIEGGMAFAEAADTFSTGPAVGAGGSLGSFSFGDLAESWREALEGIEEGEISEPFEADGKQVLLRVDAEGERSPAQEMDDRTRDELYEQIRKEKFEELFEEFMDLMRERAVIEYK